VGEYVVDLLSGPDVSGKGVERLHIERRPAYHVSLFLGNIGKLAQITPDERSGLIGLPLDKKPQTDPPPASTIPPGGSAPPAAGTPSRPPKGKALKILAAIKGLTKEKAKTAAELGKLAKVDAPSVGELFFRLYNQKRIGRTDDKPFRFYDPETEKPIICATRNGKQIARDLCNPNPALATCKACTHYHD